MKGSRTRLAQGTNFGRWTVVGERQSIRQRTHHLCRCECGSESLVSSRNLLQGRSRQCVTCAKKMRNRRSEPVILRRRRARASRTPERTARLREYFRRVDLQKTLNRYKMSVGDYEKILADQAGVCAICHRPERDLDVRYGVPKRLTIDHCHRSEKFRGLLCSNCNKAIGLLEDDPELAKAATDYLVRHLP